MATSLLETGNTPPTSNQITSLSCVEPRTKYSTTLVVPSEFPLVLKNLAREILRSQPANIYLFAVDYFQKLLDGNSGLAFVAQEAGTSPRVDEAKATLAIQPPTTDVSNAVVEEQQHDANLEEEESPRMIHTREEQTGKSQGEDDAFGRTSEEEAFEALRREPDSVSEQLQLSDAGEDTETEAADKMNELIDQKLPKEEDSTDEEESQQQKAFKDTPRSDLAIADAEEVAPELHTGDLLSVHVSAQLPEAQEQTQQDESLTRGSDGTPATLAAGDVEQQDIQNDGASKLTFGQERQQQSAGQMETATESAATEQALPLPDAHENVTIEVAIPSTSAPAASELSDVSPDSQLTAPSSQHQPPENASDAVAEEEEEEEEEEQPQQQQRSPDSQHLDHAADTRSESVAEMSFQVSEALAIIDGSAKSTLSSDYGEQDALHPGVVSDQQLGNSEVIPLETLTVAIGSTEPSEAAAAAAQHEHDQSTTVGVQTPQVEEPAKDEGSEQNQPETTTEPAAPVEAAADHRDSEPNSTVGDSSVPEQHNENSEPALGNSNPTSPRVSEPEELAKLPLSVDDANGAEQRSPEEVEQQKEIPQDVEKEPIPILQTPRSDSPRSPDSSKEERQLPDQKFEGQQEEQEQSGDRSASPTHSSLQTPHVAESLIQHETGDQQAEEPEQQGQPTQVTNDASTVRSLQATPRTETTSQSVPETSASIAADSDSVHEDIAVKSGASASSSSVAQEDQTVTRPEGEDSQTDRLEQSQDIPSPLALTGDSEPHVDDTEVAVEAHADGQESQPTHNEGAEESHETHDEAAQGQEIVTDPHEEDKDSVAGSPSPPSEPAEEQATQARDEEELPSEQELLQQSTATALASQNLVAQSDGEAALSVGNTVPISADEDELQPSEDTAAAEAPSLEDAADAQDQQPETSETNVPEQEAIHPPEATSESLLPNQQLHTDPHEEDRDTAVSQSLHSPAEDSAAQQEEHVATNETRVVIDSAEIQPSSEDETKDGESNELSATAVPASGTASGTIETTVEADDADADEQRTHDASLIHTGSVSAEAQSPPHVTSAPTSHRSTQERADHDAQLPTETETSN